MTAFLSIIILSYLMGSIPTSLIAARLLRGIDLRQYGSGNAGATNAIRILGWKPGLAVMAVDIAKGVIPTLWLAPFAYRTILCSDAAVQLTAGCAAIIGHIWTVFARFRGGKGVGTGAGVLLVLYPGTLAVCLIIFGLVASVTRVVALGSISAALAFPLVLSVFRYTFGMPVEECLYWFSFVAAALILFTHRSNIKNIMTRLNGKRV